ncbi:excinuclease ABC subunit C [Mariprofundus micogutta]|uniref:UvrABC system protein C n=1 Tax=Mariprofundus micogutta TaxID=1921010 RepID=A0A1L8CJI8_9PROT|nr:excinuclease ABC subunit UvrC [Mariprofundus micogutta]GAV19088.1 excinuclease ABC subunit C [Mariprofundus micogutta]
MWIEAPVQLNTLPHEPGVYRMLDANRKVLYVGKARSLRKRVSSYFQRRPDSPRTQAMVQQIRDITFSVTASEAEALVLEHNLIKQLKPRYNVLMKDSKSYPYILLTDEAYPKLHLYRGKRSVAGEYFGPFPNAGAVHATLHVMQNVFRIRDCEYGVFNNRSRPCMQHQIGRCTAPCCDLVSRDEYGEQVNEVRVFLKGQDEKLLTAWQAEMQMASNAMQFEKAALLRDRIMALRTVLAGSDQSNLPDNADAISIIRQSTGVLASIGVRRAGRDLGTHNVRITQAADADDLEILQILMMERYRTDTPPAEILLSVSEADCAELKRLMRLLHPNSRSDLLSPKRGSRATWLKQTRHSGVQLLSSRKSDDQQPAFAALAELLKLESVPELIAAVDNAHLGGKQTVAAITFANWQGTQKELYRRYKLDGISADKDVIEGDDYGAMQAVLTRFFRAIAEDSIPCPDLMLIDGGRGQLAIAIECAHDAGLHDLKLVAVAKGASRKLGEETLWPGWNNLDGQGIGSALKPGVHSPALLLIARVRDEAHRFAGAYMRKRKKQSMFNSALDGISGIGPAKRTALLKHFGGIEGVKKAGRSQLAQAPGISEALAERIFISLHK